MSFFSKLYRSQEAARERNRREQRRIDLFKFGPEYIEKYHLAGLERERRLVQREYDRIKTEIQNAPKILYRTPDINFYRDAHAYDTDDEDDFRDGGFNSELDGGKSKDDLEVYDTILFFKNNPSVLVPVLTANGHNGDFLDDNTTQQQEEKQQQEQSVPSEDSDSFVPFYLRPDYDPAYRTETLKKYAILLRQSTPPGYTRGKNGTFQRRTQNTLDLLTLARGGMQSARDNVGTRLAAGEGDVSHGEADTGDRTDGQRPKMTKANIPSSYGAFDPELYNPDGSLRTCHNMPSSDKAWHEARKAHYIRKKTDGAENELNIKAIFAKD